MFLWQIKTKVAVFDRSLRGSLRFGSGLLLVICVSWGLSACSSQPPLQTIPAPKVSRATPDSTKATSSEKSPVSVISTATSLAAYQRELAVHISQKNAEQIYVTNPQALLRSVVVIKFSVDAQGQLVSRDMLRSNRDRETETTAMQSLMKAQLFPAPPPKLQKNGKVELIETWLFNTNGRFQLRTIALPQLGE